MKEKHIRTETYEGPDRRSRLERIAVFVPATIFLLVALIAVGVAVNIREDADQSVALAKQSRQLAVEVRNANVRSCERVNTVRTNQRWKFQTDANLYRFFAVMSEQAGNRDRLLKAANEHEKRLKRVSPVQCKKKFPRVRGTEG